MQARSLIPVPWRDPLDVVAPYADEPFALALLSDGSRAGRWSYVAREPIRTFDRLETLSTELSTITPTTDADLPPFQGGAMGLAGYEWSATLEPTAPQARKAGWPDLIGGVYDSLVAFDHHSRRAWAIGRGVTESSAQARAAAARSMCDAPPRPTVRPTADFLACPASQPYPKAVADVVAAIGAGEVFQANIARAWEGRLDPGVAPFDVLAALTADSPAPFAGYLRLPGLAVVSNSPERFLHVAADGRAHSQPIKGTRPRHADPARDAALAAELTASVKDRAENLMIVDLMRNDLARNCRPGSVTVDAFCTLESFANVHHLVSIVSGRLRADCGALDLFASAFPPGSVTGAPKLQAMQVIARHEPPRGPYCGSLFWAGIDGAFDSNVLIRTLAFAQDETGGWRFETRAGAGITADSDPDTEDAEALAKIAAIRTVLERR
ncbi:anthranilate synthase component I family protein [Caulobacter sp. S45]|uniref:anthranilate synthase component I family protein n=1 Tax=Caulobacter sp. S45 TaxID=1641861 RepID=UPI00131D3A84|nr:anthranilate synthase component I family protein [Caulobacter sp. S45]